MDGIRFLLSEMAAKFARIKKKGGKCAFGGIKGGEKAVGEEKTYSGGRGGQEIGHESAAVIHRIERSEDKHSEAVNQRRSIVENASCELRIVYIPFYTIFEGKYVNRVYMYTYIYK